mmetsp:Transcript_53650/g.99195  ORF Transcript_53650/g.99195 Transcript_53650/m.99195 type:complete len:202 (+) Transcript_53650:1613-2218(+)
MRLDDPLHGLLVLEAHEGKATGRAFRQALDVYMLHLAVLGKVGVNSIFFCSLSKSSDEHSGTIFTTFLAHDLLEGRCPLQVVRSTTTTAAVGRGLGWLWTAQIQATKGETWQSCWLCKGRVRGHHALQMVDYSLLNFLELWAAGHHGGRLLRKVLLHGFSISAAHHGKLLNHHAGTHDIGLYHHRIGFHGSALLKYHLRHG